MNISGSGGEVESCHLTFPLNRDATWFVLAFAVACWLGSVYGFLQGAWPFGIVELIWGVVALRRWAKMERAAALDAPKRH